MEEDILLQEERKAFGKSSVIMCRMTEMDKLERARLEFFSDLVIGMKKKEDKAKSNKE